MKTIKEWQKEVYDLAMEKGWHGEGNEKSFGECIAMIHSELSEALEEYRKGYKPNTVYYTQVLSPEMKKVVFKPEGVASELADVIIRVLDTCEQFDIPLEEAIKWKHEYNKTRSYRHGNKKL